MVGEEARQAFERIGGAVSDVDERMRQIVAATSDVAAVAEQSSASAEEVSASTQETSASTQQITAAAHELAHRAEELGDLISRFRTVAAYRERRSPHSPRARERPSPPPARPPFPL